MAKVKASGPTMAGVIIGTIFGLLLGGLGALFSLVFSPVTPPGGAALAAAMAAQANKPPPRPGQPAPAPETLPGAERIQVGRIYWEKGGDRQSRNIRPIRAAFLAGTPGTYTFSEGDFNAWLRSDEVKWAELGGGWLKAEGLDVRVIEETGELQIAMPCRVAVSGLGGSSLFMVVGRFENSEGSTIFVPSRMSLGHLPLLDSPPMRAPVVEQVFGSLFSNEKLTKVWDLWQRVTRLEIRPDGLIVLDLGAAPPPPPADEATATAPTP